jgi:hypothetical protein
MKRITLILFCLLLVTSCKKTKFSPEGPTDVRIENLTTVPFTNVIYKTSENEKDVDTIPSIGAGKTSEYVRFTKAYPKLQLSAMINVSGTIATYSTGPVSFTYMQYIGQDRITFKVFIENESTKKLGMTLVIEEPLTLK